MASLSPMHRHETAAPRPPYFSVALISAAALAYEVLLVRLFSIIQWHHFVYMIISLALLGYGISGTLLAFAQAPMRRHFPTVFLGSLLLFALSSVGCFLLAQGLQFNPEEILWDSEQWWRLLLIYLLLACPFLFVATAVGLTLTHFPSRAPGVYGADLLGAAAGSLSVVLLLFWLFPAAALQALARLGLLAVLVDCCPDAEAELGIVLEQGVVPRGTATLGIDGPGCGGQVATVDRRAAGGIGNNHAVAEQLTGEFQVGCLAATHTGTREFEQGRRYHRAGNGAGAKFAPRVVGQAGKEGPVFAFVLQ